MYIYLKVDFWYTINSHLSAEIETKNYLPFLDSLTI